MCPNISGVHKNPFSPTGVSRCTELAHRTGPGLGLGLGRKTRTHVNDILVQAPSSLNFCLGPSLCCGHLVPRIRILVCVRGLVLGCMRVALRKSGVLRKSVTDMSSSCQKNQGSKSVAFLSHRLRNTNFGSWAPSNCAFKITSHLKMIVTLVFVSPQKHQPFHIWVTLHSEGFIMQCTLCVIFW